MPYLRHTVAYPYTIAKDWLASHCALKYTVFTVYFVTILSVVTF